MALQLIIPSIQIYGRVIYEWDVKTVRGTTILIPSNDNDYHIADIDNHRDSFLEDFLSLGNFLFERYKDRYVPLLYEQLDMEHSNFEIRTTWSESAVERLLCDSCFPYFDSQLKDVISQILQFINKYGYCTPGERPFPVSMGQRIWKKWLFEDFNIERPDIQIMGAVFLIYDFLSNFICFCKPELERDKVISLYGKNIYEQTENRINISLHHVYDHNSEKFVSTYTVFDIHDYLCTLLAAINSGDLEQKIITCRNCGKSFISSNQKAIYCSSACRNRANVKKSYYRKKSRIDM